MKSVFDFFPNMYVLTKSYTNASNEIKESNNYKLLKSLFDITNSLYELVSILWKQIIFWRLFTNYNNTDSGNQLLKDWTMFLNLENFNLNDKYLSQYIASYFFTGGSFYENIDNISKLLKNIKILSDSNNAITIENIQERFTTFNASLKNVTTLEFIKENIQTNNTDLTDTGFNAILKNGSLDTIVITTQNPFNVKINDRISNSNTTNIQNIYYVKKVTVFNQGLSTQYFELLLNNSTTLWNTLSPLYSTIYKKPIFSNNLSNNSFFDFNYDLNINFLSYNNENNQMTVTGDTSFLKSGMVISKLNGNGYLISNINGQVITLSTNVTDIFNVGDILLNKVSVSSISNNNITIYGFTGVYKSNNFVNLLNQGVEISDNTSLLDKKTIVNNTNWSSVNSLQEILLSDNLNINIGDSIFLNVNNFNFNNLLFDFDNKNLPDNKYTNTSLANNNGIVVNMKLLIDNYDLRINIVKNLFVKIKPILVPLILSITFSNGIKQNIIINTGSEL